MPTESKTLTAERIRKEKALASMRELRLSQLEGKLLWADRVADSWSNAVLGFRSTIPPRVAGRFPDPRAAEAIRRVEIELALKQLAGHGEPLTGNALLPPGAMSP